VWLVDGERVCLSLYPDFIMGGNDQRYRFNPLGDVWIDNRIGVEELEYTIAHELIERKLMRERGMTYERAHNEGLLLEKRMRLSDERRSVKHGKRVGHEGIYRVYVGRRGGASVWIVDGAQVRKTLDGDFCFGANGVTSSYIPKGEIWLDSAMSVEQAYYQLLCETTERKLIAKGLSYDRAYDEAAAAVARERVRQAELRTVHEAGLPPVHYGHRDRGHKI